MDFRVYLSPLLGEGVRSRIERCSREGSRDVRERVPREGERGRVREGEGRDERGERLRPIVKGQQLHLWLQLWQVLPPLVAIVKGQCFNLWLQCLFGWSEHISACICAIK